MALTTTPLIKILHIVYVDFVAASHIVLLAFGCLALATPAAAQIVTSPTTTLHIDQTTSPSLSPAAEIPADTAAALYVAKCAGCHTIGGGTLTGPDLLTASQWPRPDMEAAIKRMEKNVGPLSAQEIQDLSDLLLSGGARDRVASEQQRAALALAAQMDPGSPSRGKSLFLGRARLTNGGPPCMACHQVNGAGGTLGLDLSSVHARMGGLALVSAIEGANFNVMRAAYANRPITKQEAVHLAAWLAEPDAAPSALAIQAAPIIGFVSALLAAAFLGAMTMIYRRHSAGVRSRLVREASSSRA